MTADSENAALPDLTLGVPADDVAEGRIVHGRVGAEEVMVARNSERQNRAVDKDREGSMEEKKREGYF